MASLVRTPTVETKVPQSFVIEPQKGPSTPAKFLEAFPDSLYNKSPESILVKLLFTLLGPIGSGLLQKDYLDARLALESYGVEGFNLDKFYGDPFKFGRFLSESYKTPKALETSESWNSIKTKDAQYKNRAVKFLAGAHLGPTVNGFTKVAESGIDSEVDVFERYKFLFDRYSDNPLGIEDIGKTPNINEVVITPIADSASISQTDRFYMDSALSRIKPVDVLITLNAIDSATKNQSWIAVSASSEFSEPISFVTGNESVIWPDVDQVHWIESGKENEAPKGSTLHKYEFFHQPTAVSAYRNPVTKEESVHVGAFLDDQSRIYTMLKKYSAVEYQLTRFLPEYGLCDQRSLLRATGVVSNDERSGTATSHLRTQTIFNFSYPDTYLHAAQDELPQAQDKIFWSSSIGSAEDCEYFEIDLGEVKAVNFISFETLNKPFEISIEYDAYGSSSRDSSVFTFAKQNGQKTLQADPQRGSAWANLEYVIRDKSNATIFTRFVRVKFTRSKNTVLDSWTAEIKGLRIGRVS
jgi:hypothetical protein